MSPVYVSARAFGRDCGRILIAGIVALAVVQGAAFAQSGQVPPTLQPPPGNIRFLTAHAVGTQDYICLQAQGSESPSWVFYGPQATLSVPLFAIEQQQVLTHFLSPVPNAAVSPLPACTVSSETQELNCPTWQSSLDSSAVWGEKAASISGGTDPSCPNTGAVPCLLVKAVATRKGTFGAGYLSRTTFVQRLNTDGGAAPAGTCTVGDQALVPYTADYSFFEKRR